MVFVCVFIFISSGALFMGKMVTFQNKLFVYCEPHLNGRLPPLNCLFETVPATSDPKKIWFPCTGYSIPNMDHFNEIFYHDDHLRLGVYHLIQSIFAYWFGTHTHAAEKEQHKCFYANNDGCNSIYLTGIANLIVTRWIAYEYIHLLKHYWFSLQMVVSQFFSCLRSERYENAWINIQQFDWSGVDLNAERREKTRNELYSPRRPSYLSYTDYHKTIPSP